MMTPTDSPASSPSAPQSFECPVCREKKHSYLFVIRGLSVNRCPGCGLILLHPQPAKAGKAPEPLHLDSSTEQEAAKRYLDWLRSRGISKGKLLVVAPPGHPLFDEARKQGFEVSQQTSARELEAEFDGTPNFDAAIVYRQLEQASDAAAFAEHLKSALRPGGVVLLITPNTQSWPRKFFGTRWTEWRTENNYYFDPVTMQGLLLRHGFGKVWIEPERRSYSLRHIYQRAVTLPRSWLRRMLIVLFTLTPPPFRDMRWRFSVSSMLIAAQRTVDRKQPVCSIVMPVFNEKNTFTGVMEELLKKELPGIEKEIIVVESNSKDGTRELVLQYKDRLGVRVILEERPRGKGHAVRTGLQHATGDVILIQDADSEYDMNDYDELLEPLVNFRAPLVLGARHGGRWKMREFEHDKLSSDFLNVGHQFFTFVINFLYRQKMKDPFTMYKLFWRDCLYGLEFECNRFDFDHELIIKLVRKGYTPLEIPVNYRSRSFQEGKKVNVIRDPFQWLWYDLKFRFVRVLKRPTERSEN